MSCSPIFTTLLTASAFTPPNKSLLKESGVRMPMSSKSSIYYIHLILQMILCLAQCSWPFDSYRDVPCSSTSFQIFSHYLLGSFCTLYLPVSVCTCCYFTLHAASRSHAGLEILSMWTGHAEVQLSLQHPLPHPATFFTCCAAARRPRRPAWVDACLWCVI